MQQIYSDTELREYQQQLRQDLGVTQKELEQARAEVNRDWANNYDKYLNNLDLAYEQSHVYEVNLIDCFINFTVINVNRAAWLLRTFFKHQEVWLPWDGIGLAGKFLRDHGIPAWSQIAKGHTHIHDFIRSTPLPIICAFECIEHVQKPIDLVQSWNPDVLIHRSPFTVFSHGHFKEYEFPGGVRKNTSAGRRFSVELKHIGYVLGHNVMDYKRHINGEPTMFVKKGCTQVFS